ncbi:hypothetical protein GBAR_LOCUS11443 [Geodia barretti]|uniref:Uncharacterized protein n=1 Tax=Geodia barretti TaxID=519541 RepID=A0AA35RWB8_GEOBA|nr:hypothetical protein GBAR_LOCUS11443 [Geodia barretti]
MIGFEQGFADTENAAAAASKTGTAVTKSARSLEKAAKTGSINAIRRAQADLNAALCTLTQEVENAVQAWPFQPDEEEAYLQQHFAAELLQVAAQKGLDIREHDQRLIAHPSIVSVSPAGRAVRVDKKQVSTVRPSHLVSLLLANQEKPARFNGRNVLEAIYKAYQMLAGTGAPLRRTEGRQLPAIPLANIYESLTLMPGSGREYSRTDFARDLYRLDTDGPQETRSGAQLRFHSGRQSNIAFVDPGGHLVTYHSVAFSEVRNG